jgi:hypothetical protein
MFTFKKNLSHSFYKFISAIALTSLFIFPNIGLSQDSTKNNSSIISAQVNISSNLPSDSVNLQDSFILVGIQKGYTIYRNSTGHFFTVEPTSGRVTFINENTKTYPTISEKKKGTRSRSLTFNPEWLKDHGPQVYVRIVGVDEKGNIIEENTNHERFYLDPKTGEMLFLK